MTKSQRWLILGLLLVFSKPVVAIPISFETGDLTGWLSAGDVSVVGEINLPESFPTNAVAPTDGEFQALLSSDGVSATELETFFGLSGGALTGLNYTQGSGLARSFELNVGDTLSFDWNFVSGDFPEFANDAGLFLLDGIGTVLSSVSLVGFAGSSGYQTFSFTAATAGSFQLGLSVLDHNDQFGPSHLTVDNFNVTESVVEIPEPSTLLLMLTGVLAAALGRRLPGRRPEGKAIARG